MARRERRLVGVTGWMGWYERGVSRRRPGLWSEIAGALALVTLAVLVLNAGVFWLLVEQTEVRRRTDLALSLSGALAAQLNTASGRGEEGYRQVLEAYRDTSLDLEALYLVDRAMVPVAVLAGEVPTEADAGIRAAMFGRETHVEIAGSLMDQRWVVVTEPIAGLGAPQAALRLSVPLRGPDVPGGALGFALVYILACGGVIGLFGWARFRRSVVAPFTRVKEATERIAGGEFGYRLEPEEVREIHALVTALNDMSASLYAYRRRTAEQVASLEAANTDLQRAQEALVRSEKLAGVGRMAAGLAHEVGNPLAAVVGYVDLLEQGVAPETERTIVQRARVELDRIHHTIQALLGYARTGSGECESIEVDSALREAVQTIQSQPGFQDLEVSVAVEGEVPALWMERDKLHQVLVNLLLNAADAQPVDQIALRATTTSDGGVEIRCEDNGVGFDEIALERAFEPFFTTKDVGEGTGLGLATCMQVISGAGGTIEASNRAQGGACVRLRLPRSPSG
jgi:signal transduction histidine kinase